MVAPHFLPDLSEMKRAARAAAARLRAGCDPAWGAALADHVMASCPPAPGALVAGVWPLPGEIDLRPLMHRLAGAGHDLALPVTPPRGQPLVFRRWRPGEALVAGRFGTLHPDGEEVHPDLLLVPLLAFDRAGRRLGYGGGFYDRTIAARPGVRCIGVGFAAQEVARVPAGPRDVRLPKVATERGVILCDEKGD